MLYSHDSTQDLASPQSMATAARMSHSPKAARPAMRVETQTTRAPVHGPGASLADMYRQRAFHGMGKMLETCEVPARHDSTLGRSHKHSLTISQGSHHAQRPPRQDCHSMGRGRSLQGNPLEACRGGTHRVSSPQHQAIVTEGSVHQKNSEQRGAGQPYWWQRLSSVAAACAVAALLTASGPCSPAEARARLTQVDSIFVLRPCEHFAKHVCPYLLTASTLGWLHLCSCSTMYAEGAQLQQCDVEL